MVDYYTINTEETYSSIKDAVNCGIPEEQILEVVPISDYMRLLKRINILEKELEKAVNGSF